MEPYQRIAPCRDVREIITINIRRLHAILGFQSSSKDNFAGNKFIYIKINKQCQGQAGVELTTDYCQ